MVLLLFFAALASDPWGPHLGVTGGELRPPAPAPDPPEGTFLDPTHEPARIPPDCSAHLRFRDGEAADSRPTGGLIRLDPHQAARFGLPLGPFGPGGAPAALVWAQWTTKSARVPDDGWHDLHACCVTQPDLCSEAIAGAWYFGSGELRPVLNRRATALLRDLEAGRPAGRDHRALGEPQRWEDAWFALRIDPVSPPSCAEFAQASAPPGVLRQHGMSDPQPTPEAARAEARARAVDRLTGAVFVGLDPNEAHRDAMIGALSADHACIVQVEPDASAGAPGAARGPATAPLVTPTGPFTAYARLELSDDAKARLRGLLDAP